jgi:hypothetical protein
MGGLSLSIWLVALTAITLTSAAVTEYAWKGNRVNHVTSPQVTRS